MENRIDLNSASVATLTQLPGVAKNVAYAIVNYRCRHGGFAGWEDLKKLRSLPGNKLAELQARAFLGKRRLAAGVERKVISRWRGKSKHDGLHCHG